ncbi:TraR/DksA C4-type zinc finger protein [Salmonella enterica]|nr:TraR/DksA C4-type zinc finger protein [Salmonella enterica]
MADDADVAFEYETIRVNEAVNKIRSLCRAEGNGLFCNECGIRIPEMRSRIIPGVLMCVTCQEIYEHRRKVFKYP